MSADADLLTRSLDGLAAGAPDDDPRGTLWEQLDRHGLAHPFLHGARDWRLGAAVIRRAGFHALGLPLAENVLCSWVLSQSGTDCEGRRLTLADPACSELTLEGGQARGRLRHVPHASVCSHVLAASDGALAWIELRGVVARAGRSLAGEPRDDLQLRGCPATVCLEAPDAGPTLAALGTLMRAGQMLGLSEWVLAETLDHCRTRQQFGRPLGARQAVRHQLATLAGEVAAAQMAVGLADRALAAAGLAHVSRARPAIAAAAVQAADLCEHAIGTGHQLHGALGFSQEHLLHTRTQRLMVYRSEFGYAQGHARWLGERSVAGGAEQLWTDPSADPQAPEE